MTRQTFTIVDTKFGYKDARDGEHRYSLGVATAERGSAAGAQQIVHTSSLLRKHHGKQYNQVVSGLRYGNRNTIELPFRMKLSAVIAIYAESWQCDSDPW